MTKLDGKWALVEATNLEAYADKVHLAEEHRAKLRQLGEAIKSDPNAYLVEIRVNKEARTIHRTVWVHGEVRKDSGDYPIGTEVEKHAADGRTARVKLEFDADKHQLIGHIHGEKFQSRKVYELEGDKLVVTSTCDGVSRVMKFRKV